MFVSLAVVVSSSSQDVLAVLLKCPTKGPVMCLQTSGSRRGVRDRISRAAESGAVVPKLHRAGKIDCMMGVKVPNLGSGRRGAKAHRGATRVP